MPGYSKSIQLGRTAIDYTEFRDACPESELQAQCEEYLRLRNVPFIRIPDGVYATLVKSPKTARLAGEMRGVPDLTILDPTEEGHNRALLVELKSKNGRLRQGQKTWARKANMVVVRNFDGPNGFIEVLNRFLEKGK